MTQLQAKGFSALCDILREEGSNPKSEMAQQIIQEELEKAERSLGGEPSTEKLLDYNEKLHLYRKSCKKTISTVQAMEG